MAEPFIGEIRVFASSVVPKGWAACNGQLLPLNQNQALYAILGTTYGGNGTTNFALPNLQGRAPVHVGNGVSLGESAGEETHTLTVPEMPAHNHQVVADSAEGTSASPDNGYWAANAQVSPYAAQATTTLAANAIASAGGSQAHNNMQPFLVANFCIAVQGIFPSRN